MRVATAPVGCYRVMTGRARFVICRMKYPATGLSSMDQIMVSIEWDPAYSDDQVILIGEIDGHAITVQYRDEWAASGK